MLAAMARRLAASVALLAVLAPTAACDPAPATGESTPTAPATALVAPAPTDGGAARKLRDRYAATQRLAEKPAYKDESSTPTGWPAAHRYPC
jgi:hypothetical protein